MRWTTRLLYYAVTAAALGIGLLQARGIAGGFVTNYGADLVGPAWLYLPIRLGRSPVSLLTKHIPPPSIVGAVLFMACVAWEVCQLFDLSGTPLGLTRGRFDPLDIVSYAASLAACVAIDTWWQRGASSTSNQEVDQRR